MLTSKSHPILSRIYWITAVNGRQIALLIAVTVKPESYPITLKILRTWIGIDRPSWRSTATGA